MADPTSNSNLALWRLIEDAFLKGREPGFCDRLGYAAELRAIAEEVWNRGLSGEAVDYGDIFNWLHAEADRAEAGVRQTEPILPPPHA